MAVILPRLLLLGTTMINFDEAPVATQLNILSSFLVENPYYGFIDNSEEDHYALRALARKRITDVQTLMNKFTAVTNSPLDVFDLRAYTDFLRAGKPTSTHYGYYHERT